MRKFWKRERSVLTESRLRAVVREELVRALHDNSDIRYLFLQGARAEAWAIYARFIDAEEAGTDPAEKRLCHFCPFNSTPVAVMEHEALEHGLPGPHR